MNKLGSSKAGSAPVHIIPKRLCFGLPVLLAIDIALLLWSFINKGAIMHVGGEAPFGILKSHIAAQDNFFSAIQNLYESGALLLVVVIGGMSGLLPVIKILSTGIVVGLVNRGTVTKEMGCKFLIGLETIGKFSYADITMIAFMAMVFNVRTEKYHIGSFGALQVHLFTELGFAPFALLIAISMSSFLTHWAIHELTPHTPHWVLSSTTSNEAEPILNGASKLSFMTILRECTYRNMRAIASAIVSSAFLVTGCCTTILRIEREGFLGMLISPKERAFDFQVFSSMSVMSKIAHETHQYMLNIFSFSMMLVCFIVPMFEIIFLTLSTTFSRWSARKSFLFRGVAEWLYSYSSTELILVVAFGGVLEMETVVEYQIVKECVPFKLFMQERDLLDFVGLGFASNSDCFRIKSTLGLGFFLLLLSVIFRLVAWHQNSNALAVLGPQEDKEIEHIKA